MTQLNPPRQVWECPNCDVNAITYGKQNRFHNCAGLGGFLAPMVPQGQDCAVELKVREDYVGKESVRYDAEGRPIMAAEVTRDDGNDVVVYAPCANTRITTME